VFLMWRGLSEEGYPNADKVPWPPWHRKPRSGMIVPDPMFCKACCTTLPDRVDAMFQIYSIHDAVPPTACICMQMRASLLVFMYGICRTTLVLYNTLSDCGSLTRHANNSSISCDPSSFVSQVGEVVGSLLPKKQLMRLEGIRPDS